MFAIRFINNTHIHLTIRTLVMCWCLKLKKKSKLLNFWILEIAAIVIRWHKKTRGVEWQEWRLGQRGSKVELK